MYEIPKVQCYFVEIFLRFATTGLSAIHDNF